MAPDPTTEKSALLAQILVHLAAELAALTAATRTAHEAATHEESRPENKYDTRGLEASYLAGAQRERTAELQGAVQALRALRLRAFKPDERVALTALVEVEQDGTRTLCFLLPVGAGYPLTSGGRPVLTITARSPLGQALLGKTAGEHVTVAAAQVSKDYEIIAVR